MKQKAPFNYRVPSSDHLMKNLLSSKSKKTKTKRGGSSGTKNPLSKSSQKKRKTTTPKANIDSSKKMSKMNQQPAGSVSPNLPKASPR